MHTITTVPRQGALFTLELLKSHLRISTSDHDQLLMELMEAATTFVEDQAGKTLLWTTRQVSHNNNRFCLPYGPVIEVLEVKYNKKLCQEGDYTLVPQEDSVEITLPFRWKSPEVIVTYKAGYGKEAESVPSAFRHAVLGTIEVLYENKDDFHAVLQKRVLPWIQAYRTYKLI